jgi:hypothetical protein
MQCGSSWPIHSSLWVDAVVGIPVNGEGQNRTGDTTIFSRVLYQLSYLAGAQRLASGL